ncbi:hypothetical protein V6N11_045956 [Hibiscus sabdariffa]|uniref:Uncharacterized protein n=2 Tax=Hibiscus sabdariffa TaxID=183260 RepID=A0ABR2Q2J5_9ROSI
MNWLIRKKPCSLEDLSRACKCLNIIDYKRLPCFIIGKVKQSGISNAPIKVSDYSSSDSDIARKQILIRSAKKTLKLDKSLEVQIIGNEEDVADKLIKFEEQPQS